MKIKTILLTVAASSLFLAQAALGVVNVTFTGGGGSPVSFTLPEISWEITNSAGFNGATTFGIGVDVNQTPENATSGASIGGNPSAWSSTGATTFPGTASSSFFRNNDFGGANDGGIIWFGMLSNQAAVNGEIITYAGGTLSSGNLVPYTYTDGAYDVYLISIISGQAVTAPGVAVPEPGACAALFGIGVLGLAAWRRKVTK